MAETTSMFHRPSAITRCNQLSFRWACVLCWTWCELPCAWDHVCLLVLPNTYQCGRVLIPTFGFVCMWQVVDFITCQALGEGGLGDSWNTKLEHPKGPLSTWPKGSHARRQRSGLPPVPESCNGGAAAPSAGPSVSCSAFN